MRVLQGRQILHCCIFSLTAVTTNLTNDCLGERSAWPTLLQNVTLSCWGRLVGWVALSMVEAGLSPVVWSGSVPGAVEEFC